jgi:phage shock protein E
MSTSTPALDAHQQEPTELIIDVRTPAEFRQGHLEGAVNLPLDQLLQRLPDAVPDRQRALMLYCASGGRSGLACSALAQLGYARVRNGGGLGLVALSTGLRVVPG